MFKFLKIGKIEKLKNSQQGITLIELIVVIFLIVIFSMIIISDFPKIMRQHALSRATHKLAQDLRKTADLGLSGVIIPALLTTKCSQHTSLETCSLIGCNWSGNSCFDAIKAKGYGVYVDLTQSTKQYVIYADVADVNNNSDQKYSGENPYYFCSNVDQQEAGMRIIDCVIEVIDISKENSSLFIEKITDASDEDSTFNSASVNFTPPNPTVKISTDPVATAIKIWLKNTDGSRRSVLINSSGLIDIQ